MIKLAVSGCQGRMGQTIAGLAFNSKDFKIAALLEHPDHPKAHETINGIPITTDNSSIKGCDVLIEFTAPDGTMENLKAAVKHNVPMVIGTTGLSKDQIQIIREAAEHMPIVLASNMSIGVNILFKLIEITAAKLNPRDIRIEETHHVHKKDAPSGTARTMAEIAEKASGIKIERISSVREGEVIGDHEIVFETGDDTLTIAHHAKDRRMFAQGALTAARFLVSKNFGLFNMQDVLGLN
jgi:4-hydroxy-tetrahydrodipicolinate reductase